MSLLASGTIINAITYLIDIYSLFHNYCISSVICVTIELILLRFKTFGRYAGINRHRRSYYIMPVMHLAIIA